jgi:outer membrane biosynthesis protein TonB
MSPHVDILAQSEPLKRSFVGSIVLHASIVGLAIAASITGSKKPELWGEQNAVGGAVGVNPVAGLPMRVREGRPNPLANDTESRIPQAPPEKKPAAREIEDPNAIPIGRNEKKKKESRKQAPQQRFRPEDEARPNQIYSESAPALVSPMMGKAGSGGVGVGSGSPFGNRFGAYASLLQRLIAERWNTGGIDSRIQTAPFAKASMTILRDGTVRDVRLTESSGIRPLDFSAVRALQDLGRVPPLPPAF